MRLLLSRHVHLCVRGDDVVLLDLRSGKYLSLGKEVAGSLGNCVVDWPVPGHCEPEPAILKSLLERNLLTSNEESGKGARSTSTTPPSRMLADLQDIDPPQVNASDVCRFLLAHTRATLALKWRSMRSIVDRIERRRLGIPLPPQCDVQRVTELVAIFERCRPFAFSKINTCLHYSLALVEFLAGYRVFPQWVFGVKTGPFLAHCWVQQGDIVLNDRIMFIEEFTPIMVV